MRNIFFSTFILSIGLFLNQTLFAHSGAHPVRYVATDGLDQGNCAQASNPCASIAYAVNQSSKGDKIHVAAGQYFAQEMDVFYLLNDMVAVKGGYSSKDHYKTFAADKNVTTIVGIPAEYRERLAKKGFHLLQDQKGNATQRAKPTYLNLLDRYQKLTSRQQKNTPCSNGQAGEHPCYRIDLLANFPLSQLSSEPTSASDIWGYVDRNNDREYAVIGLFNGTAVIDVTDPQNPVEVGTVSGVNSTWRDVKVYQYLDSSDNQYKSYAYVTTEGQGGLQIIDLSDAPNSIELVNTLNVFNTAHNVYLGNIDYQDGTALEGHNAYLYISGSNLSGGGSSSGAYRIFDLADPVNPQLVTTPANAGYVHDATNLIIDDERTAQCAENHNPCELFIDFNENTVDIWDTSDKAKPVKISSTGYQGASYTHSGWYSKDKKYIFVQDELDERNLNVNTTLYVMDISDLSAPSIVGQYVGQTRAIDHNGFTVDDKYYMSNYKRGLTVLDVSNPAQPLEIGFFDTYPIPQANDPQFDGAWGAYPYLPSANILVSDITYGLYILKDNSVLGEEVADNSQPPNPPPTTNPPSSSDGGGSTNVLSLLLLALFATRRTRFKKKDCNHPHE